ncbi:Mpp10 protein [Westerdykella ornata]|uniref:U3 small nucleolar ribonucleoprotein protein MPP10 n=1 Tax=Westerdykella ornata TaxID=318751 RepID=A0A6A6JWY6_WESOR|nr:Mpp10 protein [Westerdykella ornata]KAF2280583.1 Mpp10 protein [Westerdykella ornata]
MAPATLSPDVSISSHTLSAASVPTQMDLPTPTNSLASLLSSPFSFLQPRKQAQTSILSASKDFLDHVATTVSETQSQRQHELRRKRKRARYDDADVGVLNLKKLHVDGFAISQVFEQGRKILDSVVEEVELSLPQTNAGDLSAPEDSEELSEGSEAPGDFASGSDIEEGSEEEEDEDMLDGNMIDGEGISEDDEAEEAEEVIEGAEDGIYDDESEVSGDDEEAQEYRPDPHGLNDGFFSIDDFNKTSEFLEQQDARGEPVDDDDEEIDYDADPFSLGKSGRKRGAKTESDVESDEGGPTFGNVDLNAPEGESDDDEALEEGDMDGLGDMANANNIMYADFFAPPAKKAGKNKKKRGRPHPHNFPEKKEEELAGAEDEMERTMNAVHRDLFEDDDDAESEGELTDLDPADPKSRRSAYERKQAKLAEEIRKLEAANVAKRQWQLSGEARAADRPMNSLLEEDLDFERAGKPVPVITAEVSEDIEALIKRRILAGQFDEVLRRRPDDLATGQTRRGRFELDDTKSGKGLAEIYEEEHLRETDPNYVDARDEKLKKEHAEIEALWKSIRGKLDSLSSWHYRPKPVVPNLEIRVDAPAIEMEDARPTAGGEVAGASMLAPQELYKPGDEKDKAEIVTKGGLPIAREELTREQKLRRRRREKAKIKKANANAPIKETAAERKTKEKKQLLGDLKRGGVQVIGKKGQITDVEGKQVKEGARAGAGNFKL